MKPIAEYGDTLLTYDQVWSMFKDERFLTKDMTKNPPDDERLVGFLNDKPLRYIIDRLEWDLLLSKMATDAMRKTKKYLKV